jgi:hypothetical protein
MAMSTPVCADNKRPKTGPQKRCQLCNSLQSAFKPKLAAFDPKWSMVALKAVSKTSASVTTFGTSWRLNSGRLSGRYITRREKKGRRPELSSRRCLLGIYIDAF